MEWLDVSRCVIKFAESFLSILLKILVFGDSLFVVCIKKFDLISTSNMFINRALLQCLEILSNAYAK